MPRFFRKKSASGALAPVAVPGDRQKADLPSNLNAVPSSRGLSIRGFRVTAVARPVGRRANSRENPRCAPRRSIFGGGGFAHLQVSFEHLRPCGGATVALLQGLAAHAEKTWVTLGFVSKHKMDISRTALAAGIVAEPWASALRLIVLRRSLVRPELAEGRTIPGDESKPPRYAKRVEFAPVLALKGQPMIAQAAGLGLGSIIDFVSPERAKSTDGQITSQTGFIIVGRNRTLARAG